MPLQLNSFLYLRFPQVEETVEHILRECEKLAKPRFLTIWGNTSDQQLNHGVSIELLSLLKDGYKL